MSKAPALASLLIAALVAVSLIALLPHGGSASTVLPVRGYIPQIASDGVPGAQPTPRPPVSGSPTATPEPTGHVSIVVRIEMTMNELSVVSGGQVPIDFRAQFDGPLPRGETLSYLTYAIINPHPTDICPWNVVYTATAFTAKIRSEQALDFEGPEFFIDFAGPKWHYSIVCPSKTFPFPNGAEEDFAGWLGLILHEGSSGEFSIHAPVYNGSPSCLHNHGTRAGTNQWGTVLIRVAIVTQPCTLPTIP